MKKLKEFWNKLTSNPIAKKAIICMLIFILIIIVIIFVASCSAKNKTYSYEDIETKLLDIVKRKYKDNLPNKNESYNVLVSDLVNQGLIKPLNQLNKDNVNCDGNIKIINNNGYYIYIPDIHCGEKYHSTTLYETLLKNIVTSGNGLYLVDDEYIFKGDNVNNFVSLNNDIYRIIKINSDGTIRVMNNNKINSIIWDDRYNNEKNSNLGINNYYDSGLNSRIKDSIEDIYNNNDLFKDVKGYFVNTPWCIGKRSINEFNLNKSVECSLQTEPYPFGLIQASEYFSASLDINCINMNNNKNCTNYNYLTTTGKNGIGSIWTLTADADSASKVYKITTNGLTLTNASNSGTVKIVTTFNKELTISSGNGTLTNPYVIKVK